MAERCAVVGVGQTHHTKVRDDVSLAGLLREAGQRALDDAEMTWRDIDAVVIGTAPDSFEGVMMPELYLADALGAAGKPILRVHTAGSVGGSTAIVAAHLVAVGRAQAGAHRRLREAVGGRHHLGPRRRPQRRRRAPAATSPRTSGPTSSARRRPSTWAGWWRSRTARTRSKNPYAHLKVPDITPRDGAATRRWCGSRCAGSSPARPPTAPAPWCSPTRPAATPPRSPPAWVHGTAIRSELGQFPGRDPVNPQGGQDCAADVYRQAGITNPLDEVDVVECYVPFSWYEPMWMENLGFAAAGRRAGSSPRTARPRSAASSRSTARAACCRPTRSAPRGMLRFAEAAMQVRGQAGEHQVDGVRTAVGHAYGGAAQYFAMWVLRGHQAVSQTSRDPGGPAPAGRARRARPDRHA